MRNLVADYNDGLLRDPVGKPAALDKLVRGRQPAVVDAEGWKAIDAAEIARGGDERPRDKFTTTAECWPPPRPRRHRRFASGCSRVCVASLEVCAHHRLLS